jgi:teichuronic acid biosynthesis glycosyltransferase TuaC
VSRALRIVSVCRGLPTPDDPAGGIFVLNRLVAMAAHSDVRAVQPLPYLPGAKPLPAWARRPGREQGGLRVENAPMFYLPGVLKSLDGRWLARSIEPIVERLHRERPIDLIDAHFGYPDGAGCLRVAQRLGVPCFITVRGFETERVHDALVGPQMVKALRAATGCIAVSHSLADLLIDHGVDRERVRVIHNAIDRSTFRVGDLPQARLRLGLDASAPLIVSVARLISLKRHHVLLDAFARLRRQRPDARLAIVGGESFEPRYPEQLRAQAEALGVAAAVHFVGNLPPAKVADWLQAADLFALLSTREGCCNAVLEALATGVPAIVTPVGDNAHFVVPGQNGDIVCVDDSGATADALLRGLQPGKWNRQEIAQRLARQVGDWGTVAGRVLEFFRQRLQAGPRDRPRAAEADLRQRASDPTSAAGP